MENPIPDKLFMDTINFVHMQIDQCQKYYFGDRLKTYNYIPEKFIGAPTFIGELSVRPANLPILIEYIELYEMPGDENRTDKAPKRAMLLTQLPQDTIRISIIYFIDRFKTWMPGPFSYYMFPEKILNSKEFVGSLYKDAINYLHNKGINFIPTNHDQFENKFKSMALLPIPQSTELLKQLMDDNEFFSSCIDEENQDIVFLNAALILLNDPTRFEKSESIQITKE